MERKVQAVKEDSVKYEEEWRGEREREEERERQTQGKAKETGVMKRQREEGSGRKGEWEEGKDWPGCQVQVLSVLP